MQSSSVGIKGSKQFTCAAKILRLKRVEQGKRGERKVGELRVEDQRREK